MQVNSNIYNYLGSTMMPKKRNTTHNSSELKSVYTSMAKYNKKSPLYILSMNTSKQNRIIDIKEAAITLQDVAASLSNTESDVYRKRIIESDDPDAVTGGFKSNVQNALPDKLSISISELAKEQVNTGTYLDEDKAAFSGGRYSFSIHTSNGHSNFTINVEDGESNIDIQKRTVQYINNRKLGITASIIHEGADNAIMLSSDSTGLQSDMKHGLHFEIFDTEGSLVQTMGLDNMSTAPADSVFSINGEQHTSTTNHISINQTIELDFHKKTDGDVQINFIPDRNIALSQVDSFIEAYNNLADMTPSVGNAHTTSRKLSNDIGYIVSKHTEDFAKVGITMDETGRLHRDTDSKSANMTTLSKLFSSDSSLIKDIQKATKRLTLDPIAYIDKVTVTYPNVKTRFGSAYTQALYSGLMYNNYI